MTRTSRDRLVTRRIAVEPESAATAAAASTTAMGLLLAAMLLGGAGCAEPAADPQAVSRSTGDEAERGFAIGASEWSRGGRRSGSRSDPARESDPPSVVVESGPPEEVDSPPASESTAVVAGGRSTDDESFEGSSSAPQSERSGAREPAVAAVPMTGPRDTDPPAAGVEAEPTDQAVETTLALEATPARPARETPPPPTTLGTRESSRSVARSDGPEIPLSTDPLEAAISILVAGTRSPDPVVRANALEGMLAWPSLLREHVAGGLVDGNRGVRFVAAMCVGRAGLTDLAHLVQPLLRDPSESVRAAAIYALRSCGRPVDPSPLATMVRSDDPEVRSNAYIVLGELGDASSAAMVRESLGRGMRRVHPIRVRIVELQAAETLVRLGSDDELEVIRAALFAPVEQGELSILACQILARIGDRSAAPMLERLVLASGTSARPPEIRMAATQALADLGRRSPVDAGSLAVNAVQSPDPLLRAQGCAVAGSVGDAGAMEALRACLSDPVEFVRITAAGNLLKATSESSSVVGAAGMR